MIYRFGRYELNTDAYQLCADGRALDLEPQVFALLALLVENRERLVSKDEIIEKVWDGRVISDAAIASRIRSARQIVDDDGTAQRVIKTLHGVGYRFIAAVTVLHKDPGQSSSSAGYAAVYDQTAVTELSMDRAARPSLAVLPFRLVGDGNLYPALATALPDELISELSRVRWLFVTARGSSFRLQAAESDMSEVGRLLRVRYCLTGTIEASDRRVAVSVELIDTLDSGIVWAERFAGNTDDLHAIRADICSRVLVALEIRIPLHEAALARMKVGESIDAWSAYHLGLQHMYRFNHVDNGAAAKLFQRAIALDPYFARAHAGLSFIHFQSAFMRYTDDLPTAIQQARRFAERAVELDALDPFVNFAMGRTYWLDGDLESSFSWLERATHISPHYAQGIYARAWSEALAGRVADSQAHVDLAMRLSPLDPLHYAMLATRAFAHIAANEYEQAAQWGERAARSPGAHVLIAMVATAAYALNGDSVRASMWAGQVRARRSTLTREDFVRAFPMKPVEMRARVLDALARSGF